MSPLRWLDRVVEAVGAMAEDVETQRAIDEALSWSSWAMLVVFGLWLAGEVLL